MMNYELACKTLNIDSTKDNTETDIKRQYRINALKYHPDKNPTEDTSEQFHKIQDAYEYLMKYEGYVENDNPDIDPYENPNIQTAFRTILLSFINDILREEVSPNMIIFHTIIKKVSSLCEKKAIKYLENLDKSILIKVYEILNKYQESFHYTKTFMHKIQEIIQNKNEKDECILLNPSLEDMYNEQLYKLTHNNSVYAIPLWHHELVYDISGNELYVKCVPLLNDNIEIDSNNDIYITVSHKFVDILREETIYIECGPKMIPVQVKDLNIVRSQRMTIQNMGIPRINPDDIYDTIKKSNVYIQILLS